MREHRLPWSQTQPGWHVADWGWWGWAETIVKLAGVGVALAGAADGGGWSLPEDHRLAYFILTTITVGYFGTVVDRYLDREVVAMVFVFTMIIGHLAIVFTMGRPDWPPTTVRLFSGLMAAGDLIKLGYFATTGAQVRRIPHPVPITMTGLLALAYLTAAITV